MKNQFILFIITSFLFLSCNSAIQNNDSNNNATNKALSEKQQYDTLKKQFDKYENAFITDDRELVYSYIYADGLMKYYNMMFPNEKIDKQYIKDSVIGTTSKMFKLMVNKGLKMSYLLDSIKCKSFFNNVIIWKLTYNVVCTYKGKDTYKGKKLSQKSYLIAISRDSGYNWKFFDYDENAAPVILAENFGKSVSDEMVNCNDSTPTASAITKDKQLSANEQFENLKKQFLIYENAFVNGNIELAYNYAFADGMINTYSKKFPNEKIDKHYIDSAFGLLSNFYNDLVDKGIKLKFSIDPIKCKINYNNNIIWKASFNIHFTYKDKKRHEKEDIMDRYLICISSDGGYTWKFLDFGKNKNQDDTPLILSDNFDKNVSDEIVNCK